MKKLALIVMLLIHSPAHALSDGSGWQMVVQLTEVIGMLNEQLQTYKEVRDTVENLQQLEDLKSIENMIADTGVAELMQEARKLDNNISLMAEPLSIDLDAVKAKYKRELARYKKGDVQHRKINEQLTLIGSIETLQTLVEYNETALSRANNALNDSDATRLSAQSNAMISQTLLEMHLQAKQNRLNEAEQAAFENKQEIDNFRNSMEIFNTIDSIE